MKERRLTFGKPKNITSPGHDCVRWEFPFSAIDSGLIGSPEEAQATTIHRLTVECVRSRFTAWNLSEGDLQKVLFEIGKRKLLQRAAAGALKEAEDVHIDSSTHGATCPYDPPRLDDPNGVIVTVPDTRNRIGF